MMKKLFQVIGVAAIFCVVWGSIAIADGLRRQWGSAPPAGLAAGAVFVVSTPSNTQFYVGDNNSNAVLVGSEAWTNSGSGGGSINASNLWQLYDASTNLSADIAGRALWATNQVAIPTYAFHLTAPNWTPYSYVQVPALPGSNYLWLASAAHPCCVDVVFSNEFSVCTDMYPNSLGAFSFSFCTNALCNGMGFTYCSLGVGPPGFCTLTGSGVPTANAWNWARVEDNGTTISMYLNGLPVGSTAHCNFMGSTNNNGGLLFGTWKDYDFKVTNGAMAYVRLSNTIRNTGTYTPSFAEFTNDAFTVGLWPLNDGPGSLYARDLSSNNNTGIVSGVDQAWSVSGTTPSTLTTNKVLDWQNLYGLGNWNFPSMTLAVVVDNGFSTPSAIAVGAISDLQTNSVLNPNTGILSAPVTASVSSNFSLDFSGGGAVSNATYQRIAPGGNLSATIEFNFKFLAPFTNSLVPLVAFNNADCVFGQTVTIFVKGNYLHLRYDSDCVGAIEKDANLSFFDSRTIDSSWHKFAFVIDSRNTGLSPFNQGKIFMDGIDITIPSSGSDFSSATPGLILGKTALQGTGGGEIAANGYISGFRMTPSIRYTTNYTSSACLAVDALADIIYDFHEGTGTLLHDVKNGHNGTLTGSLAWTNGACGASSSTVMTNTLNWKSRYLYDDWYIISGGTTNPITGGGGSGGGSGDGLLSNQVTLASQGLTISNIAVTASNLAASANTTASTAIQPAGTNTLASIALVTATSNSLWATANNASGTVWTAMNNASSTVSAAAVTLVQGATNSMAKSYTTTFTSASLTAGILTVTHNLGSALCQVIVYDNGTNQVVPSGVVGTSANVTTIDLTSYGTITGTWNVRIIR